MHYTKYNSNQVLDNYRPIHDYGIKFLIDDQKDALFGLFICTQSPLHVSGDVFAHHQEHLTVFTVFYIVHLCCCRPVTPAGNNRGGLYKKL